MTEVFEAKLRRIGNSLGIIIPSDIIDEMGYENGDMLQVALPLSAVEDRNKYIFDIAGKYSSKISFKRETMDRF